MDIFRLNGFPHVVPPDRNMKGNPDVFERIRATNATIRRPTTSAGCTSTPTKCPNASTARGSGACTRASRRAIERGALRRRARLRGVALLPAPRLAKKLLERRMTRDHRGRAPAAGGPGGIDGGMRPGAASGRT
jgi:hypothetical protein